MKRDNDLLRKILFDIENGEDWLLLVSRVMNKAQEERKFEYHVDLLCDAGLMTQISGGGYRMTSQGHDFLEAVRDDAIWEKTKAAVNTVSGVTLAVLSKIAVAYGKQKLKEITGLELE